MFVEQIFTWSKPCQIHLGIGVKQSRNQLLQGLNMHAQYCLSTILAFLGLIGFNDCGLLCR